MAKDANLGITAHNPVVPTAVIQAPTNAPDQAALAGIHGAHQAPAIPPDAALYPADMKLGDAAASLGNQVLADGNAEAPHYDQNGNKTA